MFKKRVGKDRVRATYIARVRARKHVATFIRSHYKRNDIYMPELTRFVDIKELNNDQIVEVNDEKWIITKRH